MPKRARGEVELDLSAFEEPKHADQSRLWRLRNMWQFANLMQYIYIFGKIVKIDESIDVDELEDICMNPERHGALADMGLALLKYVSSHRGLTPEIFDEYTRRQYMAKAPQRNPFGEDEDPKKFGEFDVFTRIKILQQLSIWTLGNAERMRSMMEERDSEQTQWRIEPFGWDSDDRTYFLLDDDRLYRQTDEPLPPTPVKLKPKAKAKSKPRTKPTRSSKRQKLSEPDAESEIEDKSVADTHGEQVNGASTDTVENEQDGFGGMKWECIAVTMDEYQDFLESLRRSRDPNEKTLHKNLVTSVVPILEKRAEAQRQKALKRAREWENAQKMLTAKRSSRLAGKAEKQKEEEEAAAAEMKRRADLAMAHREQQRQQKMEEDRQSRMQTREQRLKEREVRRILHEEEVAKLEELNAKGEVDDSRHSSRNLKNELERRQKELDALKEQEEEDKWVFDCSGCGLHGENIDDGTHSIACEKCNIWQHSKCHGIEEAAAERDDFHFVCSDCRRKEQDAKKPRISLKLGKSSVSPKTNEAVGSASGKLTNGDIKDEIIVSNKEPSPSVLKKPTDKKSPPKLSPAHHRNGSAGQPQQSWQGDALQPLQQAPVQAQTTPLANGSPAHAPHYYQHQHAHANAVAAAGLHHQLSYHQPQLYPQAQPYQPTQSHQHTPGFANGWQPHQPYANVYSANRQEPPSQKSLMGSFSAGGVNTHINGSHGPHGSPQKQQQAQQTTAQVPLGRASPGGTHIGAHPPTSPYHTLSPPPNNAAAQRLAGQSPVKQISPSPPPPYLYHAGPVQSSPSMPPPAATPAHSVPAAAAAASPASSFFQATPKAAASPIPPVGEGPVIPQKHDPLRPPSRDHATETPIFPPATNLSPSRLPDGKGSSMHTGQGGPGTSQIPVKKLPGQDSSPVQPPAAVQIVQQVPVSPVHARDGTANGHVG